MARTDRISKLPDSVLHHIYSFLPFKQVVRTSLLSKRWQRARWLYPVFELDRSVFTKDLFDIYADEDSNDKEIRKKRKLVFNTVEKIMLEYLCKRQISIKRLVIDMDLLTDPIFVTFLDRYVCYGVGCSLVELKLWLNTSIYGHNNRGWYVLPQIVLFARSLVVLELKGCKIDSYVGTANLPCLKKLWLLQVNVDDSKIRSLVNGCPGVEEMTFDECVGFKTLELSDHNVIRDVELMNNWDLEGLVIRESTLQCLTIFGSPSLSEIDISCCDNIMTLKFEGVPLTDKWVNNLIWRSPFLKHLEIGSSKDLHRVEISSLSLEILYIFACTSLVELKIETPKLGHFKYFGYIIPFFSNSPSLERVDLAVLSENFDFVRFIEFLSQLHNLSAEFNLEVRSAEYVIIPKTFRLAIPSPLSSAKHLNLEVPTISLVTSIANTVDSLLWISPHATSILIKNGCVGFFEFQFTYKKQPAYEGGVATCCKAFPVSCWQHCVEMVKVEFTSYTCPKNNKLYFLDGMNIWEKIHYLCQ